MMTMMMIMMMTTMMMTMMMTTMMMMTTTMMNEADVQINGQVRLLINKSVQTPFVRT